jgi:hypothetical protein
MDSTETVVVAPDETKRISPGVRYSEGIIFGMRFKCPNADISQAGAGDSK